MNLRRLLHLLTLLALAIAIAACGGAETPEPAVEEPAAEEATYLVNRMREQGILLSTDGPLHNVIKMKPPMCIEISHAQELLNRMEIVLAEDFMKF